MIKHPCGEQGTSPAGHKIKILRYSAYEKTTYFNMFLGICVVIRLRPTSVSHNKLNSRDAAVLIMPFKRIY
jgi:hypothetical protein